MDLGRPAPDFHYYLERTLVGLEMYRTATYLLAGIIINTMALMTSAPRFVLDSTTIKHVLSLRNEISALCAIYNIDVTFQFDLLQDIPTQILEDCMSLNITGSILHRDFPQSRYGNSVATPDAQVLFNFLALIRKLLNHYGPRGVADIIADFHRTSSLHLPQSAIRKPGVGRRDPNSFRPTKRCFSVDSLEKFVPITPDPIVEIPSTKLKGLLGPLKSSNVSNARPVKPLKQRRVNLDLNDENSPALLSDAPLRMRRKTRFGLRRLRF